MNTILSLYSLYERLHWLRIFRSMVVEKSLLHSSTPKRNNFPSTGLPTCGWSPSTRAPESRPGEASVPRMGMCARRHLCRNADRATSCQEGWKGIVVPHLMIQYNDRSRPHQVRSLFTWNAFPWRGILYSAIRRSGKRSHRQSICKQPLDWKS